MGFIFFKMGELGELLNYVVMCFVMSCTLTVNFVFRLKMKSVWMKIY